MPLWWDTPVRKNADGVLCFVEHIPKGGGDACLFRTVVAPFGPYLSVTPAETLADTCHHLPKTLITPGDTCRVELCARWVVWCA